MPRPLCARLAFHALIVLTLGLLAGFPWANVINGTMEGDSRAWRMAHLEGLLNALLMLAVAAAGSLLTLSEARSRALVWLLLLAGYGNIVASIVGASTGHRGLTPTGPAPNLVVFVLFMVAVVAVFVAVALALAGAHRTARQLTASDP
ncbi:MAG: hypothetical protein AAGA81_10705 [Acidobacteriota bacterium]